MNIRLELMKKDVYRQYMKDFEVDVSLFPDPNTYKPYIYDPEQCDSTFDRYVSMGRVHFAIMAQDEVIGEVILKKVNWEEKHCTMGITLKNDFWKEKGYGTAAEKLAVQYAFEQMNMKTVYADALINNSRSRHVLLKVGFKEIGKDDMFCYYALRKE